MNMRFACMVLGASCFLSFVFLTVSGNASRQLGFSFKTPTAMLVVLLVLLLFFLLCPLLKKPLLRKLVSAANVALALVWAFLVLAVSDDVLSSDALAAAASALGLAMLCSELLQWGLHFTLSKVEDAGLIVWTSMLLGACISLTFVYVGDRMPLPLLCLLPLIGCVLCWWLDVNESMEPSSPNSVWEIARYDERRFGASENPRRTRLLYFASRIGASMLYAIASTLVVNEEGVPRENGALIVALIAMVVAGIVLALLGSRKKPLSTYLIAILPLLLAFVLTASFLGSDTIFVVRVGVGIVWLVGYLFDYLIYPTYRELTGMNIVEFSYLSKLANLVPWAVFSLGVFAAKESVEPLGGLAANQGLLVGYMLVVVLAHTAMLVRHLFLYYPQEERAARTGDAVELPEKISATVQRYGLTKREGEVLSYLAKGYSRPYIEKKLYISKGTAKTHIFHVFQKLGVSSQDELLDLVDQA